MRLWVSQIDVIAQEQQSESGGGVTGTQHAPVESQIETVPSVGAQLAPGRHTGLRWHQADTQTATRGRQSGPEGDYRAARRALCDTQCVLGGHCLFAQSLVCSDSEPKLTLLCLHSALALRLGDPAPETAPSAVRHQQRAQPLTPSVR